jgi:hypothetical protein
LSYGFVLLHEDSVLVSYGYQHTDDQVSGFDLFKCPYKDGKIYIIGVDTLEVNFRDDGKNISSKLFGYFKFFNFISFKEITFNTCCTRIPRFCRNKKYYSWGYERVYIDKKRKKGRLYSGDVNILELDFFEKYPGKKPFAFFYLKNEVLFYEGCDLYADSISDKCGK